MGKTERKAKMADATDDTTAPDVTFNKEMTRGKLALLSKSPLDKLVGTPDEAAERRAARKAAKKLKKMRARGEIPESERPPVVPGVVYVGHIPHGFYEREMKGYFDQFGEVLRVRMSRSKKTARSKGYAYVEFADAEVAKLAAEAMDGYIMHGRAVVAKFVPPEKVHPDALKGANRVFRRIPWASIARRGVVERSRDPAMLANRSRGVQKRYQAKKKRLQAMGIQYKFPSVVGDTE